MTVLITPADSIRVLASIYMRYEVGSLLPSERSLADRIGLSRGCIRDAILKLHIYGIVSVSHGKSTKLLVPVSEWDTRIKNIDDYIAGIGLTSKRELVVND